MVCFFMAIVYGWSGVEQFAIVRCAIEDIVVASGSAVGDEGVHGMGWDFIYF